MLGKHSEKEIKARTAEVLEKLKSNREQHAKIVQEARDGYVKKAEDALLKRLEQVRSGEVVDLTFRFTPPQDHTKEYDTAIAMLQLHLNAGEETITLTAIDVQQFVLDEWGWSDQFLFSNSGYSASATTLAKMKGLM